MFPFQKIFTVLIRTFSRPMLGYIKKKQQQKLGSRFGAIFTGLGRRAYAFEYWVNIRILKANRKAANQLKDELLLQKGVQTFYQILFYVIVLGLPFWQLYRSSVAAQKKQQALQHRFISLQKKMTHINQNINKVVQYSKKKSQQDKERVKKRQQRMNKRPNNKSQQHVKYNILGEVALSKPEEQSVSQKLQQIFENAIQVVGDEFQQSLDQLQFSNTISQIDLSGQAATQDPQIELQVQSVQEVSIDESSEINIDGQVSIQVQETTISTSD